MSDLLPTLLAQNGGDSGAAGGALIDWWTVAAQVVNFLLLVALLRIFLYKRVLEAMDRREKKIAAHFESAAQKEADAERLAGEARAERDDLQKRREAMLKEARDETRRQKESWTDEARAEVDDQARRWHDELRQKKEAFLDQVRRQCGEQACRVAGKALADLADAALERKMVEAFARRLSELDDAERRTFLDAARGDGGLVAATAWPLEDEAGQQLARAVAEHLSDELRLSFETAHELTCGIELRAGGHEISWTVDSYLAEVRAEWERLIDEETTSAAGQAKPAEQ